MRIKMLCIVVIAIFVMTPHIYGEMCSVDVGNKAHSEHATVKRAKETCPVTGEIVNKDSKATYKYKGKVYKFCCPACIDEFKKNPEKYISSKTDTHRHSH